VLFLTFLYLIDVLSQNVELKRVMFLPISSGIIKKTRASDNRTNKTRKMYVVQIASIVLILVETE